MKTTNPGAKPNLSLMSRETGISRQTLSRLWNDPDPNPRPRRKKPSQFDPYLEEIEAQFLKMPMTIKAVFKYFQMKYPNTVFRSYESFKSYVKANKLTEIRQEAVKAHVRFETQKGQQLQFDWKEDLKFTLKSGEVIHFNIFTAVYGWSRYVELVYSPTKTTDDLLRCLITVLKRIGKTPGEFYTDNMSAIVSVKGARKRKHDVIQQFEKDISTPIKLAKARSPQSKGKVESANRFIEWLKPWNGVLESEEELIAKIEELNREINKEASRTTHQIREVLMVKENI